MIFLSDDAFTFIKRKYMKTCIMLFINFACLCGISKVVNDQAITINNLTKKIKDLESKGD